MNDAKIAALIGELKFIHLTNVLYWTKGVQSTGRPERNISDGKLGFWKSGLNLLSLVRLAWPLYDNHI